jgi:sulfane dehydrogenase subunit SoxC
MAILHPPSARRVGRRGLLAGATAIAAGSVLPAGRQAAAGAPDPAIVEVQDWNRYLGPGVDAAPYGLPSEREGHVVRRWVPWLTAGSESSVNFTPLYAMHGFVTPNGLHFERHHGGVADIDPASHRLMIHGLVERELVFTMDEIRRMPAESHFYFIECAANSGMEWRGAQLNSCQFTYGMISTAQWTGVPLRTLLEYCGVKPNARWLLAEGADAAGMTRSIPLEKALDDCLVAYAQNGEAVRPAQGYPLRLVVPGFEGNMSIKWLRRIEVGDAPWMTREETSKYTDLLADGRARMFTYVQEAKSVVTDPCPERPVNGPGTYRIQGLAWSGHGRITRVDVSIDGGRNWRTAQLHGPVLPKCTTRFEIPWEYKGDGALIVSRAMDETGYVQPTMQELQAVRGVNSIYHNNAQQVWAVAPSGEVENVRLG